MPEPAPAVDLSPCAPLDFGVARLALVGNAPDACDRSAAIDGADVVVRFNNASGFAGRTGSRVSVLALVNRGGQMRAWLEDPGFLDRPVIRAAGAFLLPFPELPAEASGTGDGACWTREAVARLAPLGRPIHVLPDALHETARRTLAPHTAGRPNPSTGTIVALALLARRAPGAPPVEAYGFGFSGWPGHPWAAERRWFDGQVAAGHLRLHAPDPSR